MDVEERGGRTYLPVADDAQPIQLKELPAESSVTEKDELRPDPAVEFHLSNSTLSHDDRDGTFVDGCWCIAMLFMVGSLVIAGLSVIFDWLWVADMHNTQPALVFGPASSGVFAALVVFAVFGTITFTLEGADKLHHFITRKDFFDQQMEDVMSLLLEEVPQITLNLMLAMCREVPTSYFQLIKAALAIASSGLRLVKSVCYMCGCKTEKKSKKKLRFLGRLLLISACIYTFSAGVTVFVFMYKEPPRLDLGDKFYAPANVFGEAYNTERYFPNSGVFFTHRTLDHCSSTELSPGQLNGAWIRVEVIYTFLLLAGQSMESAYSYNTSSGIFWVRSMRREHCYRIDLTDCSISLLHMQHCHPPINSSRLHIVFRHTPMSKTSVFGDIKYNATLTDTHCQFTTDAGAGSMEADNGHEGTLQYFKAPYSINTSLPFKPVNVTGCGDTESCSGAGFYQYPGDLVEVEQAWRTGYKDCEMTGSVAPNPGPSLYVSCLGWSGPGDTRPV